MTQILIKSILICKIECLSKLSLLIPPIWTNIEHHLLSHATTQKKISWIITPLFSTSIVQWTVYCSVLLNLPLLLLNWSQAIFLVSFSQVLFLTIVSCKLSSIFVLCSVILSLFFFFSCLIVCRLLNYNVLSFCGLKKIKIRLYCYLT